MAIEEQVQAAGPEGVPQGPEVYIDKHECARRMGRTVRSIDTYMEKGIIPYYKWGRTVAFKWSEVEAAFREHCRVGVGSPSRSRSAAARTF